MAKSDFETNMRAGAFDRPIDIYEPVITVDEYGQRKKVWRHSAHMFANVQERVGLRMMVETKERFDYKVEMAIRYIPRIEREWRVKWEGQWYEIDHIQQLGRRKGWFVHTYLLKDEVTELET